MGVVYFVCKSIIFTLLKRSIFANEVGIFHWKLPTSLAFIIVALNLILNYNSQKMATAHKIEAKKVALYITRIL
jgi:hypothetical protein